MLAYILVITSVVTLISEGSTEEVPNEPPPLFSFDKGGIGVNFLGFNARAGLGGLVTGNSADGGLYASAGTPFGQQAGAGIDGSVNGESSGGLYAGATAAKGIDARAGLAGNTHTGGVGYAGASVGSDSSHITKVVHKSHVKTVDAGGSVGGGIGASAGFSFGGKIDKAPVVVEESVVAPVVIEKSVVAPKFVEKTVQVPTYVEKTVRVPTYVEKTIRVPSYVEKTVRVPSYVEKTVQVPVEDTVVVEKVHSHPHHHKSHVHVFKQVHLGGGGGYGGNVAAGGQTNFGGGAAYSSEGNGQFFNDIFNIPISALGSVNKFLNGLGGARASGSFEVNKSYQSK